MILVQTGTYQTQALRPFNVHVSHDNVSMLQNVTNDGLNLGVSAIQEAASDIVTPSANVEGSVDIAEGWNSRRFRFMMKVNESHPFIANTTTQRIFFGYTDQCDASMNHLDPNMRVYFNSETIITQSVRNTVNGPQSQAMIVGSNQIVSPVSMIDNPHSSMFARNTTHLIRPEDIFNIGQSTLVAERLQSSGHFDSPLTRTIDHRSMVGEGGAFKYSKRRDASPTRYLSETLNAYQHAVKESNLQQDDFSGVDRDVMFGEAAANCRNAQISTNTFLALLRERAQYMELGYVTWRELTGIFPELLQSSVTHVGMDDGRSIRKVNQAEHSEVWTGADYASIGASLLAQTIPSIMMDNYFRACSFAVTNGQGPNQYLFELHPQNTKSMIDNLDMRQYIMEFERRLGVDVLNNISRGNQVPFKISMSSDLAGDSVIDIAVGSNNVSRYIAPTFSDSLFSPVITRNEALPGTISSDMLYLVEQVVGKPDLSSQSYVHPVAKAVNVPQYNQGYNNVSDLGLL